MIESKRWLAYKLIVLYCFLASARASLTLGDNPYIDLGLGIIALFIVPFKVFESSFRRIYAAIFLAIASMYTMLGAEVTGYLAQFAAVLIPITLIFTKSEYQADAYKSLSKWFAILLIASFLWWVLWLIGIPLPHISQKLPWQHDSWGFINNNYFLFRNTVALNPFRAVDTYYRFNGFFLEPGHLGTITSLFLYVNRYDFKKRINLVFLFFVIISLSSAAYALTAIGYCLYRYTIDRWKVVIPIMAVMALIFAISQYNGGDNIINNAIFEKFTREQGALEGRFSESTRILWNETINDGSILFGRGAGADIHESAGYKVFLIMNGIIGAAFMIIAYWLIQSINPSRLGRYMFFLLIISFLQRTYCFWDAFLDPYILGTAYLCIGDDTAIEENQI